MKVIKKINNNVAICLDNNNHELIAFGIGIGFPTIPYELEDLSKIDRTYYGVNSSYLDLLNEIPEDLFDISVKIVDYARLKIKNEISENIVFTLADHIHFAIQRYEKHMVIKMPFCYDIKYLYPVEMMVGEKAIAYINKRKKLRLLQEEAVGIAMHFINAENIEVKSDCDFNEDLVIGHITKLIEEKMNLCIDKNGFNYSRFVSHMQYLLNRSMNNMSIVSDNDKMFNVLKNEYRNTYDCVINIKEYFEKNLGWVLTDEELLYLMLHVNRLCSREDCNQ